MAGKRLRCRLGFHSYVTRHPESERLQEPDAKVCRLCGKRSDLSFRNLPGAMGGGGAGF